MKKRTKALTMFVFLGGIMVSSGVLIAIPGTIPAPMQTVPDTVTGTPADNFPDANRLQFCGTDGAIAGRFITEYEIPTACTQPLAITVDSGGIVWFAQTNTGNVAKFDPKTETFEEFENKAWPQSGRSMMWGMDSSADGSIWYTDEAYNAIWKFSPEDETYNRISYSKGDSLPQKLQIDGSSVIVNDFTKAKISFIDHTAESGDPLQFVNILSPLNGSYTSDFALDGGYVWYTNWIFGGDGILVRFDQDAYGTDSGQNHSLAQYVSAYDLPAGAKTPNGIAMGPGGHVWIADTSSSSLYRFDPESETFSEYVTSIPPLSSYGNATGVILNPQSRPYWIESAENLLVFNQHAANRIGVLHTDKDRLVEYLVPSTNPNWADCGISLRCGVAQVFGIDIHGQNVWFTEWVENNIGVLDMSEPLPVQLSLDTKTIEISSGAPKEIIMTVSPSASGTEVATFSSATGEDGILISSDMGMFAVDAPVTLKITVSSGNFIPDGTYRILLGVDLGDVAVSEYVDVTVR